MNIDGDQGTILSYENIGNEGELGVEERKYGEYNCPEFILS